MTPAEEQIREAMADLADLQAELDGERNRSQMYADLVRGVAVALRGPGYSDTSKLAEEVARLRAEVEALRKDAERYRWLKDGCDEKGSAASQIAANRYGMEWDAAIDAAKGEST